MCFGIRSASGRIIAALALVCAAAVAGTASAQVPVGPIAFPRLQVYDCETEELLSNATVAVEDAEGRWQRLAPAELEPRGPGRFRFGVRILVSAPGYPPLAHTVKPGLNAVCLRRAEAGRAETPPPPSRRTPTGVEERREPTSAPEPRDEPRLRSVPGPPAGVRSQRALDGQQTYPEPHVDTGEPREDLSPRLQTIQDLMQQQKEKQAGSTPPAPEPGSTRTRKPVPTGGETRVRTPTGETTLRSGAPPTVYGEELGGACPALAYRTLIFSRAVDEQEDEALPSRSIGRKGGQERELPPQAGSAGCDPPPLAPADNPELWSARSWPLVTSEPAVGDAGASEAASLYRVRMSGPEASNTRVDDSLAAGFADTGPVSQCIACDGACGAVVPQADSGTIPSGYTTSLEACVESSGTTTRGAPAQSGSEQAGGLFIVSKLDAHGLAGGTSDKFPDLAEVLPKRAGSVTAPVIQIDGGGYPSELGASLYGTVCNPSSNTWQLTAVARDLETGENLPAGYRIEWLGIPDYRIREPHPSGQPVHIEATLLQGRHFPELRVYGPDPATGKGSGLVGKAGIHSLVVEERPTNDVERKNADVGRPSGTPFHLTDHLGSSGIPVDASIGIRGSPHPAHPSFDVRGRVSLDGYPQNEYWVGEGDRADLPQVVRIPAGEPQTFYLQGYQLASFDPESLALVVQGQAQIEAEACASALFFRDQSRCDQPPDNDFPVSVAWQDTDTEPFDSAYPLSLDVAEPSLKYQEKTPDPFEVHADHVAEDFEGGGERGGYYVERGTRGALNLIAAVDWDALAIDEGYFTAGAQAFPLDWRVAPLGNEQGGPNFADRPTLRDLERAEHDPDASGEIEARTTGLISNVQLGFTKPRGEESLADAPAKAGDRFCVVPKSRHADPSLGPRFWPRREIVVRPGDKVFHVVVPNDPTKQQKREIADFDPGALFELSDAEFAASVQRDWRWKPPLGSEQSSDLELFTFDRFRNPLPAGRGVLWSLEGGGRLGAYDPDEQSHPEQKHPAELYGQTDAAGRARVRFTMQRYPHCPWQIADRSDPAVVRASIDGRAEAATYSVVTTDEPLSAGFPPLQLHLGYRPSGRADPANRAADLLDIARGDSALLVATLTRGGRPVPGAPIAFSSSNGALVVPGGRQGVGTTGDDGTLEVKLTAAGARLTGDGYGRILVSASISQLQASVSSDWPAGGRTITARSLPRWVDSSPLTVELEHDVLVSDAFGDRFVDVDSLEDDGEDAASKVAALGGRSGDGKLRVPIYDSTRVRIRGAPDHSYHVEILRPAGGGGLVTTTGKPPPAIRLEYPFDGVVQGHTPERTGGPRAAVAGARVDAADPAEGMGSLAFSGADVVRVPSHPAVDALGGLELSLWIQPRQRRAAVLVERSGQYRVELDAEGRVQVTTGKSAPLVSEAPLPLGEWSRLELRLAPGRASLAVGPAAGQLQMVSGACELATSNAEVRVGAGFAGLLDHLRFAKGGFDPREAMAMGLGPNGTIRTDAQGHAEFQIRIESELPRDYRPVQYRVVVHGSGRAEATFSTVPKSIWGDLCNMGRAFLQGPEGHGKDATWFEYAAAKASEWIPFLSDLRTLGFEVYKAATGCDEVSWLNVTFAMVGLVADAASFGTAGTAVRGGKQAALGAFKLVLRTTATTGAGDLAFSGAVEGFVRLATVEVAESQGGGREPAPWAVSAGEYLGQLNVWITGRYQDLLNAAIQSTDDLFVGLQAFRSLGSEQLLRTFELQEEVEQQLVTADASAPSVVGGSTLGRLGAIVPTLAALRLQSGAAAAVKSLRPRAQRAKEALTLLASGVQGVTRQDRKAYDGMRRLFMLVLHDPLANEEGARQLALRIRRGLNEIRAADRKKFLEDFDDLYQLTLSDSELFRKVRGLARDFAARGPSRETRHGRTKGAAFAIQESADGMRKGKLRGPDSIEPKLRDVVADKAAKVDNLLWRDLKETDQGKVQLVELKAWSSLTSDSSIDKLSNQMASHLRRLPPGDPAALLPIVIRGPPPVPDKSDPGFRKIVGRMVSVLVARHKMSSDAAVKHVYQNLAFEPRDLAYTLLPRDLSHLSEISLPPRFAEREPIPGERWYCGEIDGLRALVARESTHPLPSGEVETAFELQLRVRAPDPVVVRQWQRVVEDAQGRLKSFVYEAGDEGERLRVRGEVQGARLLGVRERGATRTPFDVAYRGGSVRILGDRIDTDGPALASPADEPRASRGEGGELDSFSAAIGGGELRVARCAPGSALSGLARVEPWRVASHGAPAGSGAFAHYQLSRSLEPLVAERDPFQIRRGAELSVRRESAAEPAFGPSAADGAPAQAASDGGLARWVAEQVAHSVDRSATAVVAQLERAVAGRVRERAVPMATALETFRTRRGDCTELAALLTESLRIAGIPARQEVGLVHNAPSGSWLGHSWVSAWDARQRRWIHADALYPELARSLYIRLAQPDVGDALVGARVLVASATQDPVSVRFLREEDRSGSSP